MGDLFDRAVAVAETVAAAQNLHAAKRLVAELESLCGEIERVKAESASLREVVERADELFMVVCGCFVDDGDTLQQRALLKYRQARDAVAMFKASTPEQDIG